MKQNDDFMLEDLDDEKTIEFIKNYLPQELKGKFSDDEFYYFLDLIDEYYTQSGVLDAKPDADGYVDIDLDKVVDYIVKGCPEKELLSHIRGAYEGHPMLDGKVQNLLLKEYSRLRSSERSLLFFISTVSQLTAAERELVRLLLEEKKVKEIAAIRCVEVVTIKTQIKSLLRKFGCARTKEIVEIIRELNVAHLF